MAATFATAVICDFVNLDDMQYVFDNPLVCGGLTLAGVRGAFTSVVFRHWAPLTILSLELDTSLFGTQAWGYHLTNVLLHAATAAVLFLAVSRMTGRPGRSLVAIALFAVHPLRVESVAWIAERKDVLSVFFLALALLAYERYVRLPSLPRYVAVVAAMIASLLSKATGVTLPVLLLILDAWPLRRGNPPVFAKNDPAEASPRPAMTWQALVLEKMPLFAVSALFSLITIATNQNAMQAEELMPLVPVRLPNAVVAIAFYLRETVLPIGLHPAHQHAGSAGVSVVVTAIALAGLAGILSAAIRLRKSVPAIPAGVMWFLIALAPVLGVVTQLGFAARADRFTYVPHVGLAIAIVWGISEGLEGLKASPRLGGVLAAVALAVFIILSRAQIETWRDSVALWSNVVACEPGDADARICLGIARADRGETDAAISEFRQALGLKDDARAHYRLGLALADKGDSIQAYHHLSTASAIDPGMWRASLNAGIVLARMGRFAEAIESLQRAAAITPCHPDIEENLRRSRLELTRTQSR